MNEPYFIAPLDVSSIELHEIFTSYKNAGFTVDEALKLLAALMSDNE
jgi:hypothetical protein